MAISSHELRSDFGPLVSAIDQIFTPSGDSLTGERLSSVSLELRLSSLTMSYRHGALWILSLALLGAGSAVHAQPGDRLEPVATGENYQQDAVSGLALGGFDPVSFYLPEGPQPGRADLQLVWGGVAWRFAREANRVAFQATPTAFAPRIGGYDAEAARLGRVVDASPALYLVLQDRLYLFRNDANRAQFLSDAARAAQSEKRWEELKQGLVRP